MVECPAREEDRAEGREELSVPVPSVAREEWSGWSDRRVLPPSESCADRSVCMSDPVRVSTSFPPRADAREESLPAGEVDRAEDSCTRFKGFFPCSGPAR